MAYIRPGSKEQGAKESILGSREQNIMGTKSHNYGDSTLI